MVFFTPTEYSQSTIIDPTVTRAVTGAAAAMVSTSAAVLPDSLVVTDVSASVSARSSLRVATASAVTGLSTVSGTVGASASGESPTTARDFPTPDSRTPSSTRTGSPTSESSVSLDSAGEFLR
ncbi:hypothetical protein ACQI4F_01645 [Mycolicibacterium vaccae]|uniref:hypothetical protein n=1 Tax=Mycolicibacterium vaccae TaxID=1810 RepID=UPI003CF0D977